MSSEFEKHPSSALEEAVPEPPTPIIPADIITTPVIDHRRRIRNLVVMTVSAAALVVVVLAVSLTVATNRANRASQAPNTATTKATTTDPAALLGHTWRLQSLIDPSDKFPRSAAAGVTLLFPLHHRTPMTPISSGRCLASGAKITPGKLAFTQEFVSTADPGSDCGPRLAIVVDNFIYSRVLSGTASWMIHGQQLTITHPGAGTLVFHRS